MELVAQFEQILAAGPPFPSETDLSEQTWDAIRRAWAAGPPAAPLIEAARQEFARQLDGTHEAERRAQEDAIVAATITRGD